MNPSTDVRRRRPTALPFPLAEELLPAPDPWDACRKLAHLPHLLFLDSASSPFSRDRRERWAGLGRYSFVMADPFRWLWSRGRLVQVFSFAPGGQLFQQQQDDPLAVLASQLARFSAEPIPGLPPFQGGAAGLFGYDLAQHIERLPRARYDEFEVPELAVGFYDWVLAFDHAAGRAWLISTGFPESDPRRRHRRAVWRMQDVLRVLRYGRTLERLASGHGGPRALCKSPLSPRALLERAAQSRAAPLRCPVAPPCIPSLPGGGAGLASSFDRATYLATVRRALDYIRAGDCFQVNIAQRLLAPLTLPPLELYGRLRQRNPAPLAGYFDIGDFVLASASPERFLRLTSAGHSRPQLVETCPIKGTRPRGASPEQDQARVAELLASGKDRAENVMIVDLLRNDLGRVCRYGSVAVEAVCRLETYEFVHHLVSVIRARLRQGLGPVDLLRAAFPGGSVTGAPKIRAMEIIAELEPTARGPYCGSLGYIGFDGSMDTNILIRTFTIGRGWVQFPVGGGIVADSDPEREYEETWHKAEGLLRALA